MFTINGKSYNVPIESVDRKYSKDYKYQVTTEDGRNHSEVRAVYVDYSVKVGCLDESSYYDLINDLSGAESSYTAVLPYNGDTIELECDISISGDGILIDNGAERIWDGLTITFSANAPLEVTA